MANVDDLEAWVGNRQTAEDVATSAPLAGLAALLDRPAFKAVLPPLGRWLYFLPREPQSRLGPDGHAAHGDFLPPLPHPRRMWAGGRLEFLRPIEIGALMSRQSRIASIQHKDGRSGPMIFVTVAHEIFAEGLLAVREEQDLVFRNRHIETNNLGSEIVLHRETEESRDAERMISMDSAALFRFSALTFNAHKIHYDRDYAHVIEGYPGLVVHGPLLATLLVHFGRGLFADCNTFGFRFRALRPVFDCQPFTLLGRRSQQGARLWVRDHEGHKAMDAELISK